MKKGYLFLIIILSILCTSCKDNKEIHEISFVSSIGIDYKIDTNEYELILYFINTINNVSVDYGLSEPELLGYTASSISTSISDAFNKIQNNSETIISLKHLESVIFTETFFNKKNILEFYNYCKNTHQFFHAFEIFITDSKLTDIYLIENMTDSPSYYTLLTGKKSGYEYDKVLFYNFINDILTPNYYLIYPKITVTEEIYKKNDKKFKTLSHTGYSILKEDYSISTYNLNTIKGLRFLSNFNQFNIKINDSLHFYIKNYKISKDIKNTEITLKISCEIQIIDNLNNLNNNNLNKEIKLFIIDEINNCINILKEDQIDILNINFLSNNKLDYQNTLINYKIDLYIN